MVMLDWDLRPHFAYYLRSFAKQELQAGTNIILKDLASGAFFDNMAASAAEGSSVASDVLLDLAACSSRVAKRAAQCCVLDHTQEMLVVASSSITAIKGILAVAAADKGAWQAVLFSLDGWLTASSTALKADKNTAEDAVRVVQLTAACMETLQVKSMQQQAGTAADGMPAAATAAGDLAVNIIGVCSDPKVVASAVAALPLMEPSEACFRRLCAPKLLASAIQSMRPSDASDVNTVLGSVLRMSTMEDGLVLQLLIQGEVSKACVGFISAVLDQWDSEVQEGVQVRGNPLNVQFTVTEYLHPGTANMVLEICREPP